MAELSLSFPREDARNAILEAGLTVFSAHGFHGATTREIATAAGVSQPLLHHHFGGKDNLWGLVGERITTDFLNYMANAVDPMLPPSKGVRAMLKGYLGYWRARPKAYRFNLWRLLDGPASERKAKSDAITRHGVAFMQRAQEAGFVRADLPPGLVLIAGGSLVQFWLHSQIDVRDALAVTGDEQMDDETFIDNVVTLLRSFEPSSPKKRARRK